VITDPDERTHWVYELEKLGEKYLYVSQPSEDGYSRRKEECKNKAEHIASRTVSILLTRYPLALAVNRRICRVQKVLQFLF
jgi:hypothetical protein